MSKDRKIFAKDDSQAHKTAENQNLLTLNFSAGISNTSVRAESTYVFKEKIDEKKAAKLLAAKKYVTDSSELNQLVTHMLTQVIREQRKL